MSLEMKAAFHGGAFFNAIGTDFKTLERSRNVISADVLDAWFDPAPAVLDAMGQYLGFLLRTSPPQAGDGLVRKISARRNVPPASLLLSGGSSAVIFTCLPRLIQPHHRVLLLDPMYSEYEHICSEIGACIMHHRLPADASYRVDGEALLRTARANTVDAVIIVNPNSPTGRYLPRDEMVAILDGLPSTTMFIVDETYIDYVGPNESLESLVATRDNLFIIKSMSKAYALSGARVAYLAGPQPSIAHLARRVPSWAVSLPAQVAAIAALEAPEYYALRYAQTHQLRLTTIAQARLLTDVCVLDTELNFYLIELRGRHAASTIVRQLAQRDIFVRNCDTFSACFADRFLRVSVKDALQNERIVEALRQALESGPNHGRTGSSAVPPDAMTRSRRVPLPRFQNCAIVDDARPTGVAPRKRASLARRPGSHGTVA